MWCLEWSLHNEAHTRLQFLYTWLQKSIEHNLMLGMPEQQLSLWILLWEVSHWHTRRNPYTLCCLLHKNTLLACRASSMSCSQRNNRSFDCRLYAETCESENTRHSWHLDFRSWSCPIGMEWLTLISIDSTIVLLYLQSLLLVNTQPELSDLLSTAVFVQ